VATFDTVRKIMMKFPGVEEGTSYGTPAFRVKGKFILRQREDGDLAVKIGFDNAEMLMSANPTIFYTTDHYRGYPTVLIRMSKVTKQQLADVLEMAWRANAPRSAGRPGRSRRASRPATPSS
jgi:hypothetical protein